jgi:hypothetical protein
MEDLQKAETLMSGDFGSEAFYALRARLHARLRAEGDDKFSAALAEIPMMEQVSVVNVMGFMNPSDYDNFPKTQYILESAPKI